jgi:hypothetical protein
MVNEVTPFKNGRILKIKDNKYDKEAELLLWS